MKVLGLEGTAHTVSAGIIDENRVIANVSSTFKPKIGGIHPREAAIHHEENISKVLTKALETAAMKMDDIDLIAFSMGPGLGPCLRVVATAARALALKFSKPIVGVNHPLGHIEIGRLLSGASDPVMLYVSGGNTQVIAHKNGRYRVFGETIDIGIGNMLDKLGRDLDLPFPGGPRIEKLASDGKKLLPLPYSVHGMDTSFSGILTAAKIFIERGETIEDVCFSIQETAFAMLVEVLERALHYLGKSEILLAGGVARNKRLRDMVDRMGQDQEISVFLTDPEYCMDNGAMIAQAGTLLYNSGLRHDIQDTVPMQRYRIDEVDAPWIASFSTSTEMKGAESRISIEQYLGMSVISKFRPHKSYRIPELDREIRKSRMKNEVTIASRLHEYQVNSPVPFLVDLEGMTIKMQQVGKETLRTALLRNKNDVQIIKELAKLVGRMHAAGISHGDLTTSNVMYSPQHLYLIDGSMGNSVAEIKDMGQDIFLLKESFHSMHSDIPDIWEIFRDVYLESHNQAREVYSEMERIETTRRYV